MPRSYTITDIRRIFAAKLAYKDFVIDKTGVKTIEIAPAYFIADEDRIFGTPNEDYIKRELEWYDSCSLNVNDIPPPVPAIWKNVATPDGFINSNYGWAIYSHTNGSQYVSCLAELTKNPFSRRGCMIYNRPVMQQEYNLGGMSDFMCTFSTQHLIRNGMLMTMVNMRSNDAVFGYNNDYAWFNHVHEKLANDLGIKPGLLYWSAGSLHVYERHFDLVR